MARTAEAGDGVADAVEGLLPTISKRAATADLERRLPDETVADLAGAGIFRMLQPRRYGGLEAEPVRYFDIVRGIAGACGSTGWVTSVLGVHPWHVGLFPEQAQEDLWGAGPDVLVCSSYAPAGRFVPVTGGYELTGHWRFASGCGHASWALLGGMVVADDGLSVDLRTALVPMTDYRIDDVWDAVGLRGTASNDLRADRIFVPEHRTVRNYDLAQLRGPGQQANPGPLYRMPFGAIFTSAVTAPVVGVVEGCLNTFLSSMRGRNRLSFGGDRFVEDQFAQVAVARAASEVDAAALQLARNIGDLYQCADRKAQIPMELRLRARRDQVSATERARRAVDLLFGTAGGMSLQRGNPIERAWRDAHAGGAHVANETERALALYGMGAFGLEVEDPLI